ncbi:uncharacterized protein LOC143027755 [Oratosquilla oratoria]|uniref:uncharacterized protein LOC143027755 n=1 Tax=Oratosquilla oratoria TaxID=337810 RepID=UPI003F76B87B
MSDRVMASGASTGPSGKILLLGLFLPLPLVLSLLVLPAVGADTLKEYRVTYGRVRSRALVRLNTTSLLASITPPSETSPTTFIDFRKGMVMYVLEDECLVARLNVGAQQFSRVLESLESPAAASLPDPSTLLETLYVSRPLDPDDVNDALGPSLAPYCQGRTTWVLSVQRPRLPTYRDYLRSYSANMTHAGINPEDDESVSRTKRSTNRRRGRSRNHRQRRYRSAMGKNGRGARRSSSRRGRKNRGASYGLDLKDLSQPLPSAAAPINANSKGETLRKAKSPVVIAEDSHYPSLSFPRPKEDGHRFRHYRAFYTEEQDQPRQEDGSAVPPSVDSTLTDKGDTVAPSRTERPGTIVRDGRLFYRHDASRREEDADEEEIAASHRRQMIEAERGDEKGIPSASSYRPTISGSQQHQLTLDTKGVDQPSFPRQTTPTGPHTGPGGLSQSPSNAHAQVYVRPGSFGASAGSLVGSQTEGGAASQVQGGASMGGFFNARSEGLGHEGGVAQSEIQGNQQGAMGSASAHRRGQQSQAQVQMSPEGSSMAHAQAQSGTASITSYAQAGRRGGHAEAESRSRGSSSSQAHIDFTTATKGDTSFSGIGLASANTRRRGGTSQSRLEGTIPLGVSYSAQGDSDFSLGHVLPAHTVRPHLPGDMLDSIMEKVHQQQYPSKASRENYVRQDHYTGGHNTGSRYNADGYVIDEERMNGGSYVQEHENENAPPDLSADYDEDHNSKDGVAGLATYTHGHVGTPPRLGDLLDRQESLDYNGDAIFDEYGGDVYEYGEGIVDADDEMPLIDLGPKILGLETYDISSSLHPTAAGHNAFVAQSVPQSYHPKEHNLPPPPPPSSSHTDGSHTREYSLPVQGYQQPSHHDSSLGIQDSWRKVPQAGRHGPQPVLGSFGHEQPAHQTQDGEVLLEYDEDDLHGYPKIPLEQWDTHAEQRTSDNREKFPHFFHQIPETPPQRQPQIQPPLPLQTPRSELEPPTPPTDILEDSYYTGENEDRGSFHTPNNQDFGRTRPVYTQAFESQDYPSRDFERDQPRSPDQRFEQPGITHTVSRDFASPQVYSTPSRTSAASGVASHTISQSRPPTDDDLKFPLPTDEGNATSLVLPVFTDIEIPVSDYMDYDEGGDGSSAPNASTNSTEMMMMVPLEPGEPGSTHHLGTIGSGRTSLTVHTADTLSPNYDQGRFHKRPGAHLEPGDLIPGAPGFKIPTGFRGRVVLGRDQSKTSGNRNIGPQSAGSQMPIFTSAGGPEASSHFRYTPQGRHGFHMSSSSSSSSSSSGHGSLSHSSSSAAASASTSMRASSMSRQPNRRVYSYRRTVQTTGPMFQQGPGGPTGLVGAPQPRLDQQQPRRGHVVESSSHMTTQHMTSNGISMGKSWSSSGNKGKSWSSSSSPGNMNKSWTSSSSGKSWNYGDGMNGDDMCGYWSMSCKIVYGPFNESKVCKPTHVPMNCCC